MVAMFFFGEELQQAVLLTPFLPKLRGKFLGNHLLFSHGFLQSGSRKRFPDVLLLPGSLCWEDCQLVTGYYLGAYLSRVDVSYVQMVLSLIDICSLSVLLQLVFGHVFVAGSCPIHHLISFPQLRFVNVFRDLMRFQLRRSLSCYCRSSSTISGGSEMLVSFVAQHSIFQLSSG